MEERMWEGERRDEKRRECGKEGGGMEEGEWEVPGSKIVRPGGKGVGRQTGSS